MQTEITSLEEQLNNGKCVTSSLQQENEEFLLKIESLTVSLCSNENKIADLIEKMKGSEKLSVELKASEEDIVKIGESLKMKEKEYNEQQVELEKLRNTLRDAHKVFYIPHADVITKHIKGCS